MDASAWAGIAAIATAIIGVIGNALNNRAKRTQDAQERLDKASQDRPEKAWARIEASADRAEKDALRYQERTERAEQERDRAEAALDELRANYRSAIERHDELIGKNRELKRLLDAERIENERLKRGAGNG